MNQDTNPLHGVPEGDIPRVEAALAQGYKWCLTSSGHERYLSKYAHYGLAKGTEPLFEEYLKHTPKLENNPL